MLKLCDKSIVKPLSIILQNCKLKNTFSNLWKKEMLFQFTKKRRKISHEKIIFQFHSDQFLENFSEDYYLTLFLNTLTKMNCLIVISQAFVHLVLV